MCSRAHATPRHAAIRPSGPAVRAAAMLVNGLYITVAGLSQSGHSEMRNGIYRLEAGAVPRPAPGARPGPARATTQMMYTPRIQTVLQIKRYFFIRRHGTPAARGCACAHGAFAEVRSSCGALTAAAAAREIFIPKRSCRTSLLRFEK